MFNSLHNATRSGGRRAATEQDRRLHRRASVSIFGRYMLPNRQEFPCQTIDMSPGGVALAAPVRGNIGDRVIVYLDMIGRLEGRIVRHLEDGFAIKLINSLIKRDKLGDQLTWIANRQSLGLPEDRRHERIAPRTPASTLKTVEGREYPVRIIDISLSGVAVKCEFQPPLLSKVVIGNTNGRVVRHFDGGVAIEFLRLLPAENFDQNIKL